MKAAAAALAMAVGAATAQPASSVVPAPPAAPGALAELGEVVVSAPSADGTLALVPHSVSVVTASDIERSAATSLADLLAREANVNLRSFFGHDKAAAVDLRGMGDTAVSNVLVLVDGVRINELDLSGSDLTAVPLSRIARVEIVRGGGAVRFGDGAVAGVINILTKRGRPGARALEVEAAAGAYGMDDLRVNASAGTRALILSANLSHFDSEGHRDNGDLRNRGVAAEARVFGEPAGRAVEAWLRVSRKTDRYGLPGPVSAAAFAGSAAERRATAAPFDRGATEDLSATAGAFADWGGAGRSELTASFRDRRNDFVIGFSPLISRDRQLSTIVSKRRDLHVRHDIDFAALGARHTVSAGADLREGTYARTAGGRYVPDVSTQLVGEAASRGAYATWVARLGPAVGVNLGLRANRFSTRVADERFTRSCNFVFIPFPVPVGCTPFAYTPRNGRQAAWRNGGAEAGLTWRALEPLTLHASATRHFRNPNLDELAAAAADLRPQSGRTREVGLRIAAGAGLEAGLALFETVIEDEIYYGADPASGLTQNRNYDLPTRRRGAEAELRWRIVPSLALRASAGYVQPRFVGVDADVPHVARTSANAQVEWRPAAPLGVTLAVRHVGARYDGNDFTNRAFPPLPAYTVVDAAVQLRLGAAEVIVGVNNLADRVYSTLGYSATYYPMPGRSAYVRVRLRL